MTCTHASNNPGRSITLRFAICFIDSVEVGTATGHLQDEWTVKVTIRAGGTFSYLHIVGNIVGSLRNVFEVGCVFNEVHPSGAQFRIIDLAILQHQAEVGVDSQKQAV